MLSVIRPTTQTNFKLIWKGDEHWNRYVLADNGCVQDLKIRNLEVSLWHVPSDTLPSCSDLFKHLPNTFIFLSLQMLNCSWRRFSLTSMRHSMAELLFCDSWGQEAIWSHHSYHLRRRAELILLLCRLLLSGKHPAGREAAIKGHPGSTVKCRSFLVPNQNLVSIQMTSDRLSYTALRLSPQPDTPGLSETAAMSIFYLFIFKVSLFVLVGPPVERHRLSTGQLLPLYHHCFVENPLLFCLFIIRSISFVHAPRFMQMAVLYGFYIFFLFPTVFH